MTAEFRDARSKEARRQELTGSLQKLLADYYGVTAADISPQQVQELIDGIGKGLHHKTEQDPDSEIFPAPPEIITAHERFFNAEGGRYKGDIQRLEQEFKKALGNRLINVTLNPGNTDLANIRVRVAPDREAVFAVNLSHSYWNVKDYFDTDQADSGLRQVISALKSPAILHPRNLALLQKGRVFLE